MKNARSTDAPRAFARSLLALGFVALLPAQAQAADSRLALKEPWRTAILRADTLARARDLEASRRLIEPLLAQTPARTHPAERTWVLLAWGVNRIFAGYPQPAEISLREEVTLATSRMDSLALGKGLRWLGVAQITQGRLSQAEPVFRRLLALSRARPDRGLEGNALIGLGYIRLQRGEYRAARALYEEALDAVREGGDQRAELFALVGLARACAALGDGRRYERLNREVAERAHALRDAANEGDAWNNLGASAFEAGDPARAVDCYRRAWAIQYASGYWRGWVITGTNLALAQRELGRYKAADSILTEMLALTESRHYVDLQAAVLSELGELRMDQGRLREASRELRRCLALGGQVPAHTRANVVSALARVLGSMDSSAAAVRLLEAESGPLRPRLDPADRVWMERALGEHLLGAGRARDALRHLLAAHRLAAASGIASQDAGALVLAGEAAAALGLADSSLSLLQRAAGLWELERTLPDDPEWRERSGAEQRLLYTSLAELLLAERRGGEAEERAGEAFDALQRFKARTLQERIEGPHAEGSPQSALARQPIRLAALQREVLRPDEVLLDFYLGPSVSIVFAATRTDVRAALLPGIDSGLGARLLRFREVAADRNGSAGGGELLEGAGARLGSELLGPVADLIASRRRVLLSPDGPLDLIPPTILFLPVSWGGPEPLIARHEVTQIPSATLLAHLRSRERDVRGTANRSRSILALRGTSEGGAPLAGADREIRWIGKRFDRAEIVTAPNGPALPAILAECQIIHVAAHTSIDDQHPWRSEIRLGGTARTEPGLAACDIAALRLPATLAVLSGCESAGGRVLSGEGVIGLTGAFLSAGVPDVVATLWPVSDAATEVLIREFYRELERGETASTALRNAQLRMRARPATRHPFYWAGFVLVGGGDTHVRLARRRPSWLPAAAAAALLGLSWVGLRMSRVRPRAGSGDPS